MAGFAGFLHGAEIVESNIGPQPVAVNRAAVIGLVGTAPRWMTGERQPWNPITVYALGVQVDDGSGNIQQCMVGGTSNLTPPTWGATLGAVTLESGGSGPTWQLVTLARKVPWAVNIPSLVSSAQDASNYGPLVQGYSIPYALKAIQLQNLGSGFGQVVVVNVFKRQKHFTDVVAAPTFNSAGAINLGHMGVFSVILMPTTVTPVSGESQTFAGSEVQTIQLDYAPVEHGTVAIVPSSPADAAITHAYALNAIIKPSASNAGNYYFKCTTAGTSGGSAPTWTQAVGAVVTDGTVTWVNVGLSPYAENVDYSVDYRTGLVTAISTGLLASDEAVSVSYSYYSGSAYINGTDFTVDYVNGVVNLKTGGAIESAATVAAIFSYADPSKVVDADIIGGFSGGNFTGISALQTTYGTMGFFCSFLIAPGFSQNEDVVAALDAVSQIIRSKELIDSTPNTLVATAISNRGTAGQAFDVSSKRAILCFPNVEFTDTGIIPTGVTLSSSGYAVQANANGPADSPLSQWAAGLWAATVLKYGFWASPSNNPINGILGPDVQMYLNPFDPNADQNNLNAAGIVTILTTFGSGINLWGNRSAAYPTYTAPDNFYCVRHAMDQIEITLLLLALQYVVGVDGPITVAHVTALLAAANSYLRSLVPQGGLVGNPQASFDSVNSAAAALAAGHAFITVDVMPPPPLERLTWEVELDTTQLSALASQISAAQTGNSSSSLS